MCSEQSRHACLAGEVPYPEKWFAQGEVCPSFSQCADPCNFPKFGKLDHIIYGDGVWNSYFSLWKNERKKKDVRELGKGMQSVFLRLQASIVSLGDFLPI